MKASELVAKIQEVIAEHGDMKVYMEDMESACFEVREASEQPTIWGNKYLFVSIP